MFCRLDEDDRASDVVGEPSAAADGESRDAATFGEAREGTEEEPVEEEDFASVAAMRERVVIGRGERFKKDR